jgi:MFS family permease
VAGIWLVAGSTVALVAFGYLVVQVAASSIQAAQQTLIPEHVERPLRGRAAGLKGAFDIGGSFLAFLVLGALLSSGDTVPAAVAVTAVLVGSLAVLAACVPGIAPDKLRTSPPAHGRRPLRSVPPGFVRLVASRFLFLFGTYAIGRFLLLLVADRSGIDPTQAADATGGLLAIFTVATAVAALAFGRLADRRGRDGIMVLGIVVSAAGILAFAPSFGVPGVALGGLVMSVGTGAFVAANWAALTDLSPAEDAGWLMGLANIGTGGAAACAGLLGPVIDGVGFTPAILVAAIATAAALIPVSREPRITAMEQPA